jgi:hypothetical protein
MVFSGLAPFCLFVRMVLEETVANRREEAEQED